MHGMTTNYFSMSTQTSSAVAYRKLIEMLYFTQFKEFKDVYLKLTVFSSMKTIFQQFIGLENWRKLSPFNNFQWGVGTLILAQIEKNGTVYVHRNGII